MTNKQTIAIDTPFIRLDAMLKLSGAVLSGGQAKVLVQSGQVIVNGCICTMRGKKLVDGDIVQVKDTEDCYQVTTHDS